MSQNIKKLHTQKIEKLLDLEIFPKELQQKHFLYSSIRLQSVLKQYLDNIFCINYWVL